MSIFSRFKSDSGSKLNECEDNFNEYEEWEAMLRSTKISKSNCIFEIASLGERSSFVLDYLKVDENKIIEMAIENFLSLNLSVWDIFNPDSYSYNFSLSLSSPNGASVILYFSACCWRDDFSFPNDISAFAVHIGFEYVDLEADDSFCMSCIDISNYAEFENLIRALNFNISAEAMREKVVTSLYSHWSDFSVYFDLDNGLCNDTEQGPIDAEVVVDLEDDKGGLHSLCFVFSLDKFASDAGPACLYAEFKGLLSIT